MRIPLGPVLRFHLHVGVRLALRALLPLVIALVAGLGLGSEPSGSVIGLGSALAGADDSYRVPAVIGIVAIGTALWARVHVIRGLTGWVRHLPVPAAAQRRSAALAIAAAQGPWLLVLAALILVGRISGEWGPAWGARLAGIPLISLSAACVALPLRRRWVTAPLGLAACALAASGTWAAVLGSAGLLVVADRVGGALLRPAERRTSRRPTRWMLPVAISWRVLRWRVATALLPGAAAWGACRLLMANNAPGERGRLMMVALAGGAGVTLMVASLASDLHRRRPPWAWSRTLPWSSSRRVLLETFTLALPAAILIPAFVAMDLLAGLAVASVVPWLAARAAAALATGATDPIGPGGRILLEGLLAFGLAALLPWSAVVFLAAAPIALRWAAVVDRRQAVSRRAESRAWGDA